MRYPQFLKNNGTIGFVAPSFGCATEPYFTAFKMAQDKFKDMGYKLDLGPNVYMAEGIGISNKPELCAKELMDMYQSKDNDVLISCGGGELMCEILDFIDWDLLKGSDPKFYLGYSDNTNFTFLSNILMDTASIYGPCAASFAMPKWHKALEDTFEVLTGKDYEKEGQYIFKKISSYDSFEIESLKTETNPAPEYNLTMKKELKLFKGDKLVSDGATLGNVAANEAGLEFEGRLIGGCLDCLANILGTKFDKVEEFIEKYKDDKIIWFLESCDLNVFDIRRALWRMDNAGWFKNAAGFIIGRPMHYNEPIMNLDQYSAVTGIVGKYNLPIIMDADFGHLPPSMPIISGSYARLKAKENNIDIFYYLR
ncbi:MAG: LD-carboxypeptidase [Lachnospira sp.]|nr:LD-carboxypeptidase [Lachnospira sp.]